MKRIAKIVSLSMVLFVGCAFTIPAVIGTLESHAASKIKISKTKATIAKGKTLQLKLNGAKKRVKWTTSNKKIATVNKNGKVSAKKVGRATITAKIGKKKYRCKVTVKNPSTARISNTRALILEGETLRLEMFGTKSKVKWYSSNKQIATVNKYGRVSAKKPGKVTITAKVGKKVYKCNLTVDAHSAEIYVDFSAAKKDLFFMTVKYTDKYGTHIEIDNQQRAKFGNPKGDGEFITLKGSGSGVVTVIFDGEIVMTKKVVFK